MTPDEFAAHKVLADEALANRGQPTMDDLMAPGAEGEMRRSAVVDTLVGLGAYPAEADSTGLILDPQCEVLIVVLAELGQADRNAK